MADNLAEVLTSLDEFETRLSSLFQEIEYINEVPIMREEYTQISAHLRTIQTGLGLTKTTRMLRDKWPHIFVTYLSMTAAFNDNRGYWDAVVNALGINDVTRLYMDNTHWGRLYLMLIEKFGLETFEGVDKHNIFVTPIRLQGGIPRYSLPDFFEYYILPSLERSDLMYLDDEEAFIEVQGKSGAKYYADQVINRYMRFGEQAALDFFSRCRGMAKIALAGDPLPPPSQLNLRPFVIQALEDFLANRAEKSSGHRISSPRLTFYPHQPAFGLYFPEQSISERAAHYQYHWRLKKYIDNQLIKESFHPVRVYRKGMDIFSRSVDLTLEQPVHRAVVDFGYIRGDAGLREFHSKRSWPLRILPEAELPQVAAFSDVGKTIRMSEGLPADYCWLLIPKDSSIRVIGEAARIEEISSYWQPWNGWKAELWDISKGQLVEITNPAFQNKIFPVIHPVPEPRLVASHQIPFSRDLNGQPLFIGKPPGIELLSGHSGRTIEEEDLEEWKMCITSQGLTEPIVDHTSPLSDQSSEIEIGEGTILIRLEGILGERPIGTFQMVLSHREGKEIELPFRCWPDLEIRGLSPLVLPEGEGGKTVSLEIDLPLNTHLDAITDPHRSHRQPNILVGQQTDTGRTFLVGIPPGVTTGAFVLTCPSDENTIHVPLDLCIPRLKWSVNFDQTEGGELNWQDRLLDVPLPKIEQSELTQLYIGAELPQNSKYTLSLSLVLTGSERVLMNLDSRTITDRESRCKFIVNPFLDTIRSLPNEPFFDLELLIAGGHLAEPARLPMMRITRTIDVRNAWLDLKDGATFLHWNEPNPLQHRRAQIWSVWQPWLEPIEVKLPDSPPQSELMENGHWFMHDLSSAGASFKESCYAVRFTAVPIWVQRPIAVFPPLDDVKVIQVGDPKERLAELDELLRKSGADPFSLHFERACIFDDLGNHGGKDQEVSWCSSHANQAAVPMIINFYHWLEGKDAQTQKGLRMRMFRPDWLLTLFLQIDDPEMRRDYLRPLLVEDAIHPTSAKIILEHADLPEVTSLAVNALVEDENEFAVQFLLNQIYQGRSSVLGAFEVLKPRADFALFALLNQPESHERDRLLQELSSHAEIPLLIYTGWWIRSDAGWGCIEGIVDPESEVTREYFRVDKEKPLLNVILRPGSDNLNIEIDLRENRITFEDHELYLCAHETGCFNYISNDRERLIGVHNRVAHGGLQPCFRTIRSNTHDIHQEIIYRPHPPDLIEA
jgi:hypothetical protein